MFRHGVIIALLALVMIGPAFAQQEHNSFTKEISFISDNDNYTLQRRDGYYTNGLNISFQQLSHKIKSGIEKSMTKAEVGQMIFNPYKYSIVDPEQMDRPFAGYLFTKLSRIKFFENGSILQYGASVGLLGRGSGGQSFQRKYHKLINIYEVKGWDYQLKPEPTLNLHLQYVRSFSKQPEKPKGADLHFIGKADVGTAFTNATAGLVFRMGWMERPDQSAMWNGRLRHEAPKYSRDHEFFLFYQPEVMAQLYNVALQGGMFRSDKGPVTAEPEPFLYQHRIGLMYAKNRCTLALISIHRTREARGQYRKENYGSIQFSYRLH